MVLDLRPYMHGSPHVLPSRAPAYQTFRLFRDMGLRHVIVVDENNDLTGIVTRHDLTEQAIHDIVNSSHRFTSAAGDAFSTTSAKRPCFCCGSAAASGPHSLQDDTSFLL